MVFQEVKYSGRIVRVSGAVSKSGRTHQYVTNLIGLCGVVTREAKNGMLLVDFGRGAAKGLRCRAVPAGCVVIV